MRIDLHVFDGDGDQAEIIRRVRRIEAHLEELLMTAAETAAFVKRMNDGLDNIAADIRRIKENTDDTALKAELEKVALRVEGIAAETPEPVPPPST